MKMRVCVSLLTVALLAGCAVQLRTYGPPPVVVYEQPAPVPPPVVVVPDYYVLTDQGYIGWVGDRYLYLGPGGVWFYCDEFRLRRFHVWANVHRDYRNHAIPRDHGKGRGDRDHEHERHDDHK